MDLIFDFDGTITVVDQWPEIGEIDQEMVDLLRRVQQCGHKIILSTSREGNFLRTALSILIQHGLIFDAVNENLQSRIERFGGNPRKVTADVIFDDRALGYTREAAIKFLESLLENGSHR